MEVTNLFVIIIAFSYTFQMIGECHKNESKQPKLLLISLDGFRWDYLSKVPTNTTNFSRFINEGCHARCGLKNIFTTLTYPNHFALVSGLYAESHGVVGNKMFDPEYNETFTLNNVTQQSQSKWFDNGAEPIWVTNQLQGNDRRSGTMFWPGSYAPVKGVQITRKQDGFDFKSDTNLAYETRVDILMKWFTDEYPINLGLLYIEEPDETGHNYGPDSQEVKNKIMELDKIVGYLLKKVKKADLHEELNIILTSDHGMMSEDHFIDLSKVLSPDLYRMFDWNILPNKGQEDLVYNQLLKASKENGHFKVHHKNEVPSEYFYSKNRRIMPIVLEAEEHYGLAQNLSSFKRLNKGAHGYNNSLQDMHPIFLAMGPAFKKGASVESFNNLDVYPLMCHILGLKPAPNNGTLDIVKELLHEKQNTTITFATYIATSVLIAFIAGVFMIAACRQNRKLKQNRQLVLSSVPDGIKFSTLLQNEAQVPLLSDSEDSFN
ncbi:ectonucleotide pyrophosphatase/phosphodiesterase family member 5 [Patella vulgata]|uniref:ectonucleotide pyrophosphatase/phosphodiesterase family member 5 n=1 Tax=Patella vulgata TaxID=6465 RepID=UPI00217FF64E|nr:ectonucleotide pyrophosphatase/phosphodiesterase family member 5 [Patella vulgata]